MVEDEHGGARATPRLGTLGTGKRATAQHWERTTTSDLVRRQGRRRLERLRLAPVRIVADGRAETDAEMARSFFEDRGDLFWSRDLGCGKGGVERDPRLTERQEEPAQWNIEQGTEDFGGHGALLRQRLPRAEKQ